MQLRPSEIRFSQDSINNYFDKRSAHSRTRIGTTLDDICEGRCNINSIPSITVVKEGGVWITADNRRLWVFRESERLDKCQKITVRVGYSIPSSKRTSRNGGKTIIVRGLPGGNWHSRPTVFRPPGSSQDESMQTQQPESAQFQINDDDQSSRGLRSSRPQTARSESESRPINTVSDPLSPNNRFFSTPVTKYASKYAYGISVRKTFVPGVHPEHRKIMKDDKEFCYNCFDIQIPRMAVVEPGKRFGRKRYFLPNDDQDYVMLRMYRSTTDNPIFVDEPGCFLESCRCIDLKGISFFAPKQYIYVEMLYTGDGVLQVTTTVQDRKQIFEISISTQRIE